MLGVLHHSSLALFRTLLLLLIFVVLFLIYLLVVFHEDFLPFKLLVSQILPSCQHPSEIVFSISFKQGLFLLGIIILDDSLLPHEFDYIKAFFF